MMHFLNICWAYSPLWEHWRLTCRENAVHDLMWAHVNKQLTCIIITIDKCQFTSGIFRPWCSTSRPTQCWEVFWQWKVIVCVRCVTLQLFVYVNRERCIQELRRNGLTPPSELASSKLGPVSPNRWHLLYACLRFILFAAVLFLMWLYYERWSQGLKPRGHRHKC